MKRIFLISILAITVAGCNINRDIMLKTPADYEFDVPPEKPDQEYRISANDILQFRLFANEGFKLIDLTVMAENQNQNPNIFLNNTISYLVESDGTVKLPIIGRIDISGNTVREAQLLLQDLYKEYYNKPFVLINVVNRRVVVFPGSGGNARVITLVNNNTTLMEALALAGGIADRGNASKVKLMRQTQEGRKVYLIDLSKIEGLKMADMIVQANDYIYVEPTDLIAREVARDVAPYVSLLTSVILVISSISILNN